MADDSPAPAGESDLRRRAAWLLVMLAVVAVLFVTLMTTLLNTDGGSKNNGSAPGPDDSLTTNPSSTASRTHPATHPATKHALTSTSTSTSASAPHGAKSCPTSAACILDGDVGNAVQAINAFRARHKMAPIPGATSVAAQTCALHRGSGCSGGWAETEIGTPNGTAAVAKIQQFAKLLDPQMKSIDVGWAFDPGSKTYYLVTIRQQ